VAAFEAILTGASADYRAARAPEFTLDTRVTSERPEAALLEDLTALVAAAATA